MLTTIRLKHAIRHFLIGQLIRCLSTFCSSPCPPPCGKDMSRIRYSIVPYPGLIQAPKNAIKIPKNSQNWSYLLWAAGEWHAAVGTRANRASWPQAAGRRTGGSNSRAANALARLSEARPVGRNFAFAAALTHGFDGFAHHLYSEPIRIWYYVEYILNLFEGPIHVSTLIKLSFLSFLIFQLAKYLLFTI